jgi:hypothetical protein
MPKDAMIAPVIEKIKTAKKILSWPFLVIPLEQVHQCQWVQNDTHFRPERHY